MIESVFTIFNVTRIFTVAALGFFVAIVLTPVWNRILHKYNLGKQLRSAKGAPIFHELHKAKEGTPTMGGVVIWVTVSILTLVFWYLSESVDGFWSRVNFFSRGQTWLPFGAMIVAAIVGLADDLMGILRKGPRGGGLRMWDRILLYVVVAAGGAWWFYTKLDFNSINVPFLGDFTVGWWYIPFFVFIVAVPFMFLSSTGPLAVSTFTLPFIP